MTEVLHSPSSSSSPSISTPTHNPPLFHQIEPFVGDEGISRVTGGETEEEEENRVREKREDEGRDQLSLLALLVTLFRKSFWVACKTDMGEFSGAGGGVMEISWPSDVEHVNHVTFDRFDGFLGLPVEFEPEVPRRAPSARYAEGIFRITAGNSQEEFVRDQLNRGVVPQGIDVHCLAGLIKAWFRELPRGVLDSLSPEQVMQCQSEDDCFALVRLLPPTEAALLDWAINLMADVVQVEHLNKMNARNIAMVFAPNMTQMDDPLTALMHAVQVMNFLKTLIEKTLREREDPIVVERTPVPHTEPEDDDNGHHSSSRLDQENRAELNEEPVRKFVADDDPGSETSQSDNIITDEDYPSYSTYTEESDESGSCETTPNEVYRVTGNGVMKCLRKTCRSSDSNNTGFESRIETQQGSGLATKVDKERKGISKVELYKFIDRR
ncbi:hypothetical protein DH2020_027946 [Rehmannia glutinosa]|uniref:Rho-GAP domain-containing protein n=1 Tax=Rehmannia glutinosa TaxID=99300 RepID=A0ABR0VVI1_REHGL